MKLDHVRSDEVRQSKIRSVQVSSGKMRCGKDVWGFGERLSERFNEVE